MKEIIILNIYPIILYVLTFFGAKYSGKKKLSPDFLSLEQTKLIQGFACLAIIIHHITQDVTKYGVYVKGPITIYNFIGIVFTAIFFFFSGYGLTISVYTKENYLNSFLKKRLPTVLIPFWTINILGVLLLKFGYGVHYTIADALSDISGLTLVNSNGWFIIEIVFLYIFFFVFFSLIKNKDVAAVLLCISVVLLIIYSFCLGHDPEGAKSHWFRGEWWFNSTITFAFGVLFARFKDKIVSFYDRHYVPMLIVTIVLFIMTLYASIYTVIRFGYYVERVVGIGRYGKQITLLAQMAVCIVFVMLVLIINMRIKIGNPVLKYISSMSVELFLIHGYFVGTIFGNVRMKNELKYPVMILSSIACTAIVSPVVRWLVKMVVNLLNSKKKYNDTLEAEIEKREREKRRKTMRTVFAVVIIIGLPAYIFVNFGSDIFAGRLYSQECEQIKNAKVGDEVSWGHFETDAERPGKEALKWIVVKRTGDDVCLIAKQGIGGYWYNQKHEAVSWEGSDIRELINSKEYVEEMMNKYELASVVVKNDDILSLLTVDEALEYFDSDEDRELSITPIAQMEGTNVNTLSKVNNWDMKGYRSSWWWLRGKNGEADIYAPVVTVDGVVSEGEKEVNRTGGAIRPVVWVNCSKQADAK